MLFYLDNFLSVGPESPRARLASARLRERGLNENYARELLELHTLGVDGGYSQQDVEALAGILTGWTLSGVGVRATVDLGFTFQAALHQPGPKTLLGVTYRGAGVHEGEEAIRDLCAHPSTARFVASKLVGHFVSDSPPPGAVDRVSDAFRASGGNLREVAACLVELDEAWDPAARKIRTPQDWIVAVLRAAGARTVPPQLLQMLDPLRQPLWAPPSPKGYGDVIGEWSDPDHLMNRIELARGLAQRIGRVRFDPVRLLDVVDVPADDPLRGLLGDSSIPSDERAALAFAGPAFHWR
jgi:uncharacterized protein (DUF1800 family)